MHRSVVFQITLGSFLLGIAIASLFVVPTVAMWVLVLAGSTCLVVQNPRSIVYGCAVLALAIGIWRTTSAIQEPSLLSKLAAYRTAVTVEGYADGDASTTSSNRTQWPFHVVRVDFGSGPVPVDDRILIFAPYGVAPRYGQMLTLGGKVQLPKNFDDFDYASFLAKDGIHAILYFPTYDVPMHLPLSPEQRVGITVHRILFSLRDRIAGAISRAVPEPEAPYLVGILVGARSTISNEIKTAFSRTGTSHIIAISGYNITIIAGALMMLCAPLGKRRAFILTILGVVLFTFLTGASPSVVRAAIMGILALVAQRIGRQPHAGGAILFSASAMCLYNPLLLRWDVGFQLSFLALIGVIFVEPLIVGMVTRILRWEFLAVTAATTIAAQIMVLPLLLFEFGQLPVYGLPVNLLVLPLVPLAMALGFATAICGMIIPFAGQLVGQSAWLVAALQLRTIQWFSHLPYAAPEVHISIMMLMAAYIALAVWLIAVYRRRVPIHETLS